MLSADWICLGNGIVNPCPFSPSASSNGRSVPARGSNGRKCLVPKPSPTSSAPQHHAFAGKVTGQTFGTATTGLAINLLRIEENLSAAWHRLSGTYVENLPWLDCAERYDRAHTFHYIGPLYWQAAGYGVDFPFENYERMVGFMRRHPDIRRVFEGFRFETLGIRYTTGSRRQMRAEISGELVFMNWESNAMGGLFVDL